MVMSKQSEKDIPLLEVTEKLGGSAKAKDIYPIVTKRFPQLMQEELDERLSTGGSSGKTESMGSLAASSQKRSSNAGTQYLGYYQAGSSKNDKYEGDFKSLLFDRLHELTPRQHENLRKWR